MAEPQTLLQAKRFRVIRQPWTGSDGREHVYDTIQHPGAVTIVPLLDDGRVCLLRNYRVAVDETLIELPAGTLEEGEAPLETAGRELAEETGFRAARLEPLTEFYMSPGILNERMHVFVATGLSEGQRHLDDSEELENYIVPWNQAVEMALGGQIQDAKTLVALLHVEKLGVGRWLK